MSSLTALKTEHTDTPEKDSVETRNSSSTFAPAANRKFLATIQYRVRYFLVLIPALVSILVSGCSSIDLKRMTYDVLRQQDCLYNGFDENCTRSFALDYFDYTQARKHYLQIITQDPQTILPMVSSAVKVADVVHPTHFSTLAAWSQLKPAL